MLGKPKAIGYTFLWAIAYGFIITTVLVIFLNIFIRPSKNSASNEKNMQENLTLITVSTLAAAIARIWLIYGKAYGYGLSDGLETCGKEIN